jgi:flagellar motor switch protein FliM
MNSMSVGSQTSVFDKWNVMVRRRMPALEIVNDSFSRSLRSAFTNMVGTSIEVKSLTPTLRSYQDFLKEMPERSNINIVSMRALRGMGCWVIDPKILHLAIDNIFGGNGHIPLKSDQKRFSVTELRIIRRILDLLMREYEKAWKPIAEIKFDFVRHESSFNAVRITALDEMVLHCKFKVEIHGVEGLIDFCVPYWVLEPFKEKICSNDVKVKRENDLLWTNALESQVQGAMVTAVAVLARKEMTIGDILSMSVGEIIPIEIQDPVTMFVDGLPMIRGKYGVKNGRYAVKLDSIQHPEEFLKSPLDNARLGPSLMRSQERGELYEQFDERMAALAKEVDSIAPSKNKGE